MSDKVRDLTDEALLAVAQLPMDEAMVRLVRAWQATGRDPYQIIGCLRYGQVLVETNVVNRALSAGRELDLRRDRAAIGGAQ
jgi:hypothetical protein